MPNFQFSRLANWPWRDKIVSAPQQDQKIIVNQSSSYGRSSEINDQRTRKTHAPFLRIGAGHARVRHSCVFPFVTYSHQFSLCVVVRLNKRLRTTTLFSPKRISVFLPKCIHALTFGQSSMKLAANEIHYNLDSILESWLRIAHPCSI